MHRIPPGHRVRLGCAALLAVTLLFPASAFGADLQVYLVRHAEKATDDPRDPSLDDAGERRALALAQSLRHAGIAAVYATQYRRTQDTAAPLAAAAGVAVSVRPATGEVAADARAFAAELRARHGGEAVLVVGHSNTVPPIANALLGGAGEVAAMGEEEYDRLLLVTVPADAGARARVATLRYGSDAD